MTTASTKTGALSGCVIWLITFCVLSTCLIPAGVTAGGVTSGANPEFVTRTLAPYLCPSGSTAQVHTYETTGRDASGFEYNTTAYEMQCVDSAGQVVKDLGPTYAFVWIGLLAVIGLVAAALLAFLFAAPAGALIGRLANRAPQA